MDTPSATRRTELPSQWPPNWRVRVVDETGSTNSDLLAEAATGAPDRSVLAARHQTAGRGRLERTWEAPAGANLLVSLLFRRLPEHLHELTQRVALAAMAACGEVAGVQPTLKWPNDLLLDDRKLAGVLAQAGGAPRVEYVVVGIGLNVGWAPDGAALLGAQYRPDDVLLALLTAYDLLADDCWPAYRTALDTIGRDVRVELADGEVLGRAIDVERDGRLVVLDACGISHRFDTGDVVHLRAPQA